MHLNSKFKTIEGCGTIITYGSYNIIGPNFELEGRKITGNVNFKMDSLRYMIQTLNEQSIIPVAYFSALNGSAQDLKTLLNTYKDLSIIINIKMVILSDRSLNNDLAEKYIAELNNYINGFESEKVIILIEFSDRYEYIIYRTIGDLDGKVFYNKKKPENEDKNFKFELLRNNNLISGELYDAGFGFNNKIYRDHFTNRLVEIFKNVKVFKNKCYLNMVAGSGVTLLCVLEALRICELEQNVSVRYVTVGKNFYPDTIDELEKYTNHERFIPRIAFKNGIDPKFIRNPVTKVLASIDSYDGKQIYAVDKMIDSELKENVFFFIRMEKIKSL